MALPRHRFFPPFVKQSFLEPPKEIKYGPIELLGLLHIQMMSSAMNHHFFGTGNVSFKYIRDAN